MTESFVLAPLWHVLQGERVGGQHLFVQGEMPSHLVDDLNRDDPSGCLRVTDDFFEPLHEELYALNFMQAHHHVYQGE